MGRPNKNIFGPPGAWSAPLAHLQRRFPVVAIFTKALQIARVQEQRPVAPMGLDMVHNRGPHPPALGGANSAPRLLQQLPGPQMTPPDRQIVQLVPLGAFAPLFFRSVLRAVSLPGQPAAPGMQTRPHRPAGHPLRLFSIKKHNLKQPPFVAATGERFPSPAA